jgi:hypothetical protein
LPFTFKSILRQKKTYGNSNILPGKNIIFKKSSESNQNPSRYYNFITNFWFQHKPKYYLSIILILPRSQNPLIYYNEFKHYFLALVGKDKKTQGTSNVEEPCLQGIKLVRSR